MRTDTATRSRARDVARLVFPGVVAISMSVPSLLPGALAFDMRDDFTLSAAEIGAGVSGFYLLSTLSTRLAMPVLGRASPMAMTRAGLALSAAAVLTAALLGSKAGLLGMCAVAGLANGVATPAANMLIALTVSPRRHGVAFGLRVSAVPGAAALAAAGAYVVAHTALGWRGLCTALALGLLTVLAASFAGSSPRLQHPAQGTAEKRGGGLTSLRLLALGGLLAATACSVLSPFLVEGLIAGGADPGDAALLLAISAWVAVAARISAGVVADWFPYPVRHVSSAALMMVAAAVGMVGLALGRGTTVPAAAALLTFGIGFAWPGLLHHAAITLHPGHMARATSSMQMGTYVGAVLGPLGFGLLVQLGSYRLAWSATAVVAVLAAVILLVGRRRADASSAVSSTRVPRVPRVHNA
ncbi:MFS transporter [Geodermatophilus sp. CPCC 205506]|uniref:MFS transporter n=1 Tax=Geodermatophilus sp. CPCC 205506 TaxID=2936596 RepID=UPI003EEBCDA8